MKIEYDGETVEDDFIYGMVCNTYSVAGIANLKKENVVLDDGLFEVILVKMPRNQPGFLERRNKNYGHEERFAECGDYCAR